MLKKFKPFEATDNYTFKDPDTGHVYKEKTLKQLYTAITIYRIQNRLEVIEYLNEVVENYLCSLPENCNKCRTEELKRSMYLTIQGGIALLKNMFFQKFATQEVAEKRAAQCVTCKFNIFPDRHGFIKYADDIAIKQIGERKVSVEKELGSCEVCTCVLKSKCHFDGKLSKFNEEEVAKFKSVNCWQLKLSGQDK
jgi:hypothetical protein